MMSEIPVDIDHAKHSVGGAGGTGFVVGLILQCVLSRSHTIFGVDEIAGFVNLTAREFVIAVLVFFIRN